jgi:inorganic triphosphatase YgiF
MGKEIELKLSVDQADVDKLIHHPFIQRYATGPVVKKRLINQYFDTPEQVLRRHAMALRIRFDGKNYIQTLKKRGESRKGLTVRGEWEWAVPDMKIDLNLAPRDFWPQEVKNRPDRLAPVFRTDFERTAWRLRIPAKGVLNPATVEVALDQGNVIADAGQQSLLDPILEIELELLEGDEKVLLLISEQLGKSIPIKACQISKAERGYRLITSNRP